MIKEHGLNNIKTRKTKDNDIELSSKENYQIISFFQGTIIDNKEYKKFISAVERIVRTSNEYKKYLSFLKEDNRLNRCSILGNIDDEMASIELHHYPFTLYQIVELEIERMLKNKIKINTFNVANNVLKLHFDNLVGLVPLSISVHEAVHNGEIFIDLKQCYGNIKQFIEIYKDYILDEDFDKLKKIYEYSKQNMSSNSKDLFNVNGEYKFNNKLTIKKIEDLNLLLKNEIPE